MPSAIRIEGLDDCLRCLDKAPENVVKMVNTALRTASRKTARGIRAKMPFTFGRLVRYKVFKGQITGDTNALVGLFNKGKRNGDDSSYIPDWFKAYWMNYGTLKHRDQDHHFLYPIRGNRKRRNNEGQLPQKFFEAAVAGWEGPFFENFAQSMKEQENKLYDR